MSAICGIAQFQGAPPSQVAIRRMLDAAAHRGPDGVGIWTGEYACLAHAAFQVTPESARERQPLVSAEGRFILAADARIDNRDELIDALGFTEQLAPVPTDADLILAAYRRWGEVCPRHLLGDFVFAVWDTVDRRLFLARDALGGRSLCYHYDGRRCLIASEVGQILDLPGWETRINEAKVAEYLAELVTENEETFFESILYLRPAHCITLTPRGILQRHYWDIDPETRLGYRDDRDYAAHFGELLTAATRCRMRSIGAVGLSLSGGLDSTLLAAVAAGLLPGIGLRQSRLKTFSYVFDQLTECDEREYIQPLVDRLGLEATFIPCDDQWTLRDPSRWPVMRDYIWSDAYVRLPTAAARAARDAGCRVLLNGQFGDALFTAGCYWAADLARDGRLGEVIRALWHHRGQIDWRQHLFYDGPRQLIPSRLKRLIGALRASATARKCPFLPPDLIRRTRLDQRRTEDAPERASTAPGRWTRLRNLTANYWTEGFGEARSYHNRIGLEVESPYYDRRLIEYVMAIPADQLERPWRSRWMQRNAMAGLVPESVRERRSKTGFEPLMTRGLCEREGEAFKEILRDPLCAQRGFVRHGWLTRTLKNWPPSPDDLYYLWLAASLELWLRVASRSSVTKSAEGQS